MQPTIAFIQHLRSSKRKTYQRLLILAVSCLPVLMIISISMGPASIGLKDIVFGLNLSESQRLILWEIRAPRILMTLVTGAGLAVCGVILQSLFRNPLADPGIIGVSSGAALAAAIGFWLQTTVAGTFINTIGIPMIAFVGACLALFLLMLLAGKKHSSSNMLILSGVAINTAAMTLLGVIIVMVDDTTLRQISFWSMGSYAGIGYFAAWLSMGVITLATLILWRQRQSLLLIAINEKHARLSGVNTNQCKHIALCCVAAIVAVCVCFTGIVGFVGLIVPHICRMLVSSHLSILLPLSALVGAILVALADSLARILIAPAELPIGLITSLLGIPFFIFLIYQQQRKYVDV